MKQKKAVSILCLVLAVIMILSLVISVLPGRAYAVTQADIDALRAKKNEISQRVAAAQERLNGLQEQEAGVLEQKDALEVEKQSAQEALDLVAEEIAMYNDMIAEKERELQAALSKEQEQLERYRMRVRAMEENGGYNLVGLIINSGSFTDLLTMLDDVGEVMESDKELELEYRAARQDVERVKAEYEAVKAEAEERQAELEGEKAELEAQIAAAEARLEELADDIAAAMEVYEAEAAAEEEAAREVTALIARYEEEQRKAREAAAAAAAAEAARRAAEEAARRAAEQAAAQSGTGTGGETITEGSGGGESISDGSGGYVAPVGGDSSGYGGETVVGGGGGGESIGSGGGGGGSSFSGGFIWPVTSGNTITGRYGEQRSGHVHSGIDIDGYGCDGSPIVAAAAGTVITSSSNSGYGNYVVIDHGSGYTTLYAHMSSNAVSTGTYVSAGQTIGYMGASGNASGTHCHFEIRINGGTADPEAWFPGCPHWNC